MGVLSDLRDALWFPPGEATKLGAKLLSRRPSGVLNWENMVMFALLMGTVFAFHYSAWGGWLYLVICKWAVQSLDRRGYFEGD
jgi:hypothetical protein